MQEKFLEMAYLAVMASGPKELRNTAMKDCPKCGLTNPTNAQRCDCGFDFSSKRVEASYLSQDELVNVQQRAEGDIQTYIIKGVLFVAVILAFSVVGAAFPDSWGRRIVLFLALVTAWIVANVYGLKIRQLLKGKRKEEV